MVGDVEAYRTIEAFVTPTEALTATQEIVARVLGSLLAGEEWRHVRDEVDRAPRRDDFALGIRSRRQRDGESAD